MAIFLSDMENLETILPNCCDIIQKNYLLLRANNLVDSTLNDKLGKLTKLLHGQRNVKFNDERGDVENKIEIEQFQLCTIENENNDEKKSLKRVYVFGDDSGISSKRKLFSENLNSINENRKINETIVISKSENVTINDLEQVETPGGSNYVKPNPNIKSRIVLTDKTINSKTPTKKGKLI